jgi:hypothetical protein
LTDEIQQTGAEPAEPVVHPAALCKGNP